MSVLDDLNQRGQAWQAERRAWEAAQAAAGQFPLTLTVTTTWQKEPRQYYANRCPLCREFGGAPEFQYTRSDGKLWLCQDCFEQVFGAPAAPEGGAPP